MNGDMQSRRTFLARCAQGAAVAVVLGGRSFAAKEKKAEKKNWIELFNKEDLTGWKPEGNASWEVKDGMLIGRQGPDNAPGDLFTEKEFGDFELTVEYKIQWPANSGVWFRYQAPDKAYQADILEYKEPVAYSGTLYCPGKMFLAANENPTIEKHDDWNTMRIKAEGPHLQIWLNKTKTADVQDDSFATGRIGFQIHAGDEFGTMEIAVRKMRIREL